MLVQAPTRRETRMMRAHSALDTKPFSSKFTIDAREACAFRLLQIGEHSNKLSQEFKEQYPDFKWDAAYRFRNVLGHGYESVSHKAIWKSCQDDIPKLLEYTTKIIKDAES